MKIIKFVIAAAGVALRVSAGANPSQENSLVTLPTLPEGALSLGSLPIPEIERQSTSGIPEPVPLPEEPSQISAHSKKAQKKRQRRNRNASRSLRSQVVESGQKSGTYQRIKRETVFDPSNPIRFNLTHGVSFDESRQVVLPNCVGFVPHTNETRFHGCRNEDTRIEAYTPRTLQFPEWARFIVTERGQRLQGIPEIGTHYLVAATTHHECCIPFVTFEASCITGCTPDHPASYEYKTLVILHVTGNPLVHHPEQPLVVNRQEAFKYTPNITGTVLEDQYQLENFKYPNGSSFPGVTADNTKSPPEIILNLPTFLNPKTYNISFDIFDTAQQLAFSAWQIFNITNRAPQQTLPTRTITFNGGTPGVDGIPSIVQDPDGDPFTLTIIPPNNTPPGLTFTKAVNLLFSTGFFTYDGAFLATNLTLNFLLKFIDPFNEELNINQTVKLIASETTTTTTTTTNVPVTTFFNNTNNTNNTNSSGNNNGAGAQTGSGGGGGGGMIPIAAAGAGAAVVLFAIMAFIIHKRRKNQTQPAHMLAFSRTAGNGNSGNDGIYAATGEQGDDMFYGTGANKGNGEVTFGNDNDEGPGLYQDMDNLSFNGEESSYYNVVEQDELDPNTSTVTLPPVPEHNEQLTRAVTYQETPIVFNNAAISFDSNDGPPPVPTSKRPGSNQMKRTEMAVVNPFFVQVGSEGLEHASSSDGVNSDAEHEQNGRNKGGYLNIGPEEVQHPTQVFAKSTPRERQTSPHNLTGTLGQKTMRQPEPPPKKKGKNKNKRAAQQTPPQAALTLAPQAMTSYVNLGNGKLRSQGSHGEESQIYSAAMS